MSLFVFFISVLLHSSLNAVVTNAFHVAPTLASTSSFMKLQDMQMKKGYKHTLSHISMVSGNDDIMDRDGKDFFDDDDDDIFKQPKAEDDDYKSPETFLEQDELGAKFEFEPHIPKLNVVTLSGRVGNVPEPRYFDDGKVVLNMGLAVKRKYHPLERKVKNIQYGQEETDWFNLELWGRDAEFAARFVDKGSRIGITGSLAIDSWTDKQTGQYRRKPKIVVRHLDVLETKAEAELRRSNREKYGGGGGSGNYYNRQDKENDDDDDDDGPSSAGTGGFFD
mmetsp:Transcript_27960/g.40894  ORF Transcript_27960/g.40894 Transcript_27960/m.40894 type:complete len:279 (+) Transcript_27960:207-1043(+)